MNTWKLYNPGAREEQRQRAALRARKAALQRLELASLLGATPKAERKPPRYTPHQGERERARRRRQAGWA